MPSPTPQNHPSTDPHLPPDIASEHRKQHAARLAHTNTDLSALFRVTRHPRSLEPASLKGVGLYTHAASVARGNPSAAAHSAARAPGEMAHGADSSSNVGAQIGEFVPLGGMWERKFGRRRGERDAVELPEEVRKVYKELEQVVLEEEERGRGRGRRGAASTIADAGARYGALPVPKVWRSRDAKGEEGKVMTKRRGSVGGSVQKQSQQEQQQRHDSWRRSSMPGPGLLQRGSFYDASRDPRRR